MRMRLFARPPLFRPKPKRLLPSLPAPTPGLVLISGVVTRKAAVAGGDTKIYLTSGGGWVAKTSASTGDRLLNLNAGTYEAGPPA